MERMGLVSQVEAELEKMLSPELLPANRGLPSEEKLARIFGVSRSTVREALKSLAARGLVERHPGRRTRAVPLDEAVTLESLSVVLDGEGRLRPGRWRLLEAFFTLKRDLMVELLVACCEKASPEDLEQLGQALFALGDEARWDEGERRWVPQEFALLKLAACAADRLGHVLLIQSLERSFQGMAKWVLPHLAPETVRPWTVCAMKALIEKNVQALKQELPLLLQACDERLLRNLAPTRQPTETVRTLSTVTESLAVGPSQPEAEREGVSEQVVANLSDNRTGSRQVSPTGGSPPGAACAGACQEPAYALPGEGRPPVHPPPSVQRRVTLLEPCPSPLPAAVHRCAQPSCCSG